METHLHELLCDRRGPSVVEASTLKAITRTGGGLALKALLACFGLATFDNLVTMTMGTQHGYEYPGQAHLDYPFKTWTR